VASDSVEPGCLKSNCPIQNTGTCELKYDTNPIRPGILKFIFLDVKILILSSDRFSYLDGFGGLVVSMLASDTQGHRFKPGRRRWIFTDVKILSMPSSGGEVKESVSCPSLVAFKNPSSLCELLDY
jgi:hypothetical protein